MRCRDQDRPHAVGMARMDADARADVAVRHEVKDLPVNGACSRHVRAADVHGVVQLDTRDAGRGGVVEQDDRACAGAMANLVAPVKVDEHPREVHGVAQLRAGGLCMGGRGTQQGYGQ